MPVTKKTAIQSELIKKAQPELEKLEKKYKGKDSQEDQTLRQSWLPSNAAAPLPARERSTATAVSRADAGTIQQLLRQRVFLKGSVRRQKSCRDITMSRSPLASSTLQSEKRSEIHTIKHNKGKQTERLIATKNQPTH